MAHFIDIKSGETISVNGALVTLVHKSGRSFARLSIDTTNNPVVERREGLGPPPDKPSDHSK